MSTGVNATLIFHLEALPLGPDQVLEEVVEHGGDPIDHRRMKQHTLDLARQLVQHLDRLQTHDVVIPCQPTGMLILNNKYYMSMAANGYVK